MFVAHTDSPVLRVKPVSRRKTQGVEQVGVECYGGGLWHTWFDRDLSVAGRVVIYTGKNTFQQRLVHIRKPILRVPTLCIHLQNASERKAFEINKEKHLQPILSTASEALNVPLEKTVASKKETADGEKEAMERDMDARHSPKLLTLLAKELNCNPADIVDFELSLCDTQPPTLGGATEEFIFAPRLDNQLHCFTSLKALVQCAESSVLDNNKGIMMSVLFDHEEVGSQSNEGAGSPLLRDSIHRVVSCFYDADLALATVDTASTPSKDEIIRISLSKSLLFSADSAHAIHPNYASKHEQNHQPKMASGTVIKTNQNQRYMTNAITGFFVRELGRQNKVLFDEDGGQPVPIPVQEFVVRNDSGCGSTIGPILAAGVGIRAVDIGIPQLSMHSIREQAAVKDLWSNYHLLQAFFKDADELDAKLSAEELH